jgi:lipid-A-disaccharide synthase
MQDSSLTIMIVAGEASGDAHAAKLVEALRQSIPDSKLKFFGSAGPRMRDAQVEATVKADEFAIVGVPEVAKALPMFWQAFKRLRDEAVNRKPDAVILVDFPEFNLKLAKSLKKRGLKVVYFISPQIWAWRKYRIRTIRKHVDLLLTILPFEKEWYSKHGVEHVEYVGNPLAGEVRASTERTEFCFKHGLDPDRPLVSLLPGSRRTEITRNLPLMLETADIMSKQDPSIQFVIALASTRSNAEVEEAFETSGIHGRGSSKIKTVQGETYDALNASAVAAVCSGTATLEAALIGTPMVVVYKGSELNYRMLMPLIDVEHIGLVNLIAGERLAVELVQNDFTPENLATEVSKLLEQEENDRVRNRLKEVTDKLGTGGASQAAAEAIIRLVSVDSTV